MTFHDFPFDPDILDGILSMGYEKPTPIQEQAIPVILEGRDMIACAQTGTGKTAAYVLPVMQRILRSDRHHCDTLVLAPTRELALQIDQQVEAIGYFTGVSSMAIYGGGDGITWEQQKRAIKEGIDMIVATPGRLISHLASGDLKLGHLKHLILDEADRMLDMGFHDDIMRIISYLPKKRQTLLFSATMPPKIRSLAQKILNQPEQINIAIAKPAEGIRQLVYKVEEPAKQPLLEHLLHEGGYSSVLLFCSTKEKVKRLDITLRKAGYDCKAFHSDLEQAEREEIMRSFKNRNLQILVGTDVLSRGIDVEGIDLVVNYDVPPDPEDYVHRIGRTARAEKTGTAITFVNHMDFRKYQRIGQLTGTELPYTELPQEVQHLSVVDRSLKIGSDHGSRRAHGSRNGSSLKGGRYPRHQNRKPPGHKSV